MKLLSGWWNRYKNRSLPREVYNQTLSPNSMERVFFLAQLTSDTDTTSLRLLDFGCGAGRFMHVFSQIIPSRNIVGVDLHWESLKMVREAGFSCFTLSSEHPILPIQGNSLDIVFSSNVIEHIPHNFYQSYLREIYRVLKPGGRFIVAAPNYPAKRAYDMLKAFKYYPQYRLYYLCDDPTHCNKQSVLKVERDLRETGFEQVRLDANFFVLDRYFRNPERRYKARILGDKFTGIAIKPLR